MLNVNGDNEQTVSGKCGAWPPSFMDLSAVHSQNHSGSVASGGGMLSPTSGYSLRTAGYAGSQHHHLDMASAAAAYNSTVRSSMGGGGGCGGYPYGMSTYGLPSPSGQHFAMDPYHQSSVQIHHGSSREGR